MDDRRGGGEIRLGLGLDFALIYQLQFSLFLHSDSLRLGLGLSFGFTLIFLLWLLSVFAGSWWRQRRVVVVVVEMGSLRVG